MRRIFSREDLHDLIWTRAVSKVAPELGISDVGLRKICRKHDIPLPDARYWGRLHAGKSVKRIALPPAGESAPEKIVIIASERRTVPEDFVQALQQARASAKPVDVPDRLHSMVRTTLALAKRASQDDYGAVKTFADDAFLIRAHPDTLDRLGLVLNVLVHHALARGYTFERAKDGLAVRVEDELIRFKLSETIRRKTHIETADEKAAKARWAARHRNHWSDWDRRPRSPQWDFTPTNRLTLEIQGWVPGCTQRFMESGSKTLVDRVKDILDGFHAWALGLKRQREEWRLNAIAAEERRQRQVERARLEAVEQCRRDFVGTLDIRIQDAERAERVLAMLVANGAGESDYGQWLRQHATQLREGLSPTAVEQALADIEQAATKAGDAAADRSALHRHY